MLKINVINQLNKVRGRLNKMDILRSPIEIIFKDQNPYPILEQYYLKDINLNNDFRKINKNKFVKLLCEKEKQLSSDECYSLYEIVDEIIEKKFEVYNFKKSIFNLLAYYTSDKLIDCGYTARCRYKELLKWRMVTLKMDSDMFICSFFAYKDLLSNHDRNSFDWETIIKSDNIRLHEMLSQGMADNHFHLNGSAPTFKLTWTSLMNNVYSINSSQINIEKNRLEKDIDGVVEIDLLITIAAIIRVILFNRLVDNTDCGKKVSKNSYENDDSKKAEDTGESEDNKKNEGFNDLNEILKELVLKRKEYDKESFIRLTSVYREQIQYEIDSLKFIFGSDTLYKGKNTKVDYTIIKQINKSNVGMRFFIGERWFLYSCFKNIYSGDEKNKIYKSANLFYAYLIIKNRVRAELVQENDKVGYSNFDEYQYRKTKYIPKGTVLKDSVEPLAILTSIKTQNIRSLEARITPEDTIAENRNFIKNKDRLICNSVFNDYNNYWVREYGENLKGKLKNDYITLGERLIFYNKENMDRIDNDFKKRYFYIVHFPKYKENIEYLDNDYKNIIFRCRHFHYRRELKNWAKEIYMLRENSQIEASRILGIDACSNELIARPEVFGQTFRFLKDHLPEYDYLSNYYDKNKLQRIRATYHVGEDFFDIIDGLRSIDEAIEFLDLSHGDRLGHAVALGINVDEWYQKKCNRVYLSKQDILDNVAWLIGKIKKYDIKSGPDTIDKLVAIYNKYYSEIYISKNDKYIPSYSDNKVSYMYESDSTVVPIDIYNKSWRLRGDNPEYYCENSDMRKKLTLWDRYAVNKSEYNGLVCELYYRYHYDNNVKIKGYEKEVFRIYPFIIDAVKEVQKNMKESICNRGIGIETNPTSNVLINTFKRYDKHPILNMYNLGLANTFEEENSISQLFVSINTDDQGVFDTLLENEYALMGIALEKLKDINGKPVYKQAKIYDWLDRIRKMGLEQSFKV